VPGFAVPLGLVVDGAFAFDCAFAAGACAFAAGVLSLLVDEFGMRFL
jgi:hypothetical protein